MKRKFFYLIIALILTLPSAASAQQTTLSDAFIQSGAKLIVVGRLNGFGRTYHEYPSEFYDSTIAQYEVVRVLKGEYKPTSIEVTFAGHLYLSDKSDRILFLTDDKDSIGLTKNFSNCRDKSCYFSDVDWIFDATKANVAALEKLFSVKSTQITEEEAVRLAEKFIEENGYTSFRPKPDKKQIALESIERTNDIKEILKRRYNTLQPKAYGIVKGYKTKNDGFTVIFRSTDASVKDIGRAVTMDLNGKNLRVQHKDIYLKAAEKVF